MTREKIATVCCWVLITDVIAEVATFCGEDVGRGLAGLEKKRIEGLKNLAARVQ
jgi:hypothetical protein